jgi:hypothetical protein
LLGLRATAARAGGREQAEGAHEGKDKKRQGPGAHER